MTVLLTHTQHTSEHEKITTSHSLSFYIKATSAQHYVTGLYVALYMHSYIICFCTLWTYDYTSIICHKCSSFVWISCI